MKHTVFFLYLLCNLSIIACSNNRGDEKIQQDINDMFKKDLAGAALNATVDNGIATVTGQCVGGGCMTDMVKRVKKINGVKDVQTNILEK